MNYNEKLKNNFDNFIIKLLTRSSCEEEIKLGIISSCLCNIDNLKEILEVFTIHNDYMFYVIKCLTYLGDNEDVYKRQVYRTSGSVGNSVYVISNNKKVQEYKYRS